MARTHVRGYGGRFRLRRSGHFARGEDALLNFRFAHAQVVLPKPRPIVGRERVYARKARNYRAQIRPGRRRFDQLCLQGIEQHVVRTGDIEGMLPPFRDRQDMVVRLMLKLRRLKQRTELGAEKLHPVTLVGVTAHAHPDEMNVVRHEAVSRAEQSFPGRRVQQVLAEGSVDTVVQPALGATRDGQGPKHDGIGLVKLAFQPREIMREGRARSFLRRVRSLGGCWFMGRV